MTLCIRANAVTTPQVPEPPALPDWAQAQKPPPKKALLVGINNYQFASHLATPAIDAALVAAALKKVDSGFNLRTVPANQLHREGLLDAFQAFAEGVKEGDVALVFYSGHGLERNGVNYLVPADAKVAEPGREGFEYISVAHINNLLEKSGAGIVVLILDACRTDPFAGIAAGSDLLDPPESLSAGPQSTTATTPNVAAQPPAATVDGSAGLKNVDLPQGFIAVYAASPGKPSFSLFKGEPAAVGSIFTRRLVNFVEKINRSIDDVFDLTSGDVYTLTAKRQKPLVSSFNGGEILLRANDNLAKDEYESWARTANSPTDQLLEQLKEFVSLFPAGPYTAAARAKIQELTSITTVTAAFLIRKPTDGLVLSGALQSASVQASRAGRAFAQQNVFVRASPHAGTSRISSLQRGEEVQVVDGAARPGWAKILLVNGTIGYVGSVDATPITSAPAALTVTVPGNDSAAAASALNDDWRKAADSSTLVINVNPAIDKNPWRARQQAFLTGLQLRDAAAAQGVQPSRLVFTIGQPLAAGETQMSIIGGVRK